ncbi:MAG: acyltransferase [Anaerolineales bacterium]|nr:MAG: acyltransferase [Anaerolineales bacterium]
MKNEEARRFYIPELDGLRFFAFLLVFIHNAPYVESNLIWKALHEYGWIGVDLFFCLSAFLITKLLVLEHQRAESINIKSFYTRRILRIWPLYFFYVFTVGFFQNWEPALFLQLLGLSTFSFNVIFLFITTGRVFAFVHLWSISYEEQFYGFIPWLLRYLTRKTENAKIRVLTLLFILGSILRFIFIYLQVDHPAIYILPITHFESLLFGTALGLGLLDKLLAKAQTWILFITGISCIGLAMLLPSNYIVSNALMLTYPLSAVGMSLIITAAISNNSLLKNILSNSVITHLGKISYGLYIFHIIGLILADFICKNFFGFTSQQFNKYSILTFALGLSLTLTFSLISYRFIEAPFLKLKKYFTNTLSTTA